MINRSRKHEKMLDMVRDEKIQSGRFVPKFMFLPRFYKLKKIEVIEFPLASALAS
jgi:hypothetical protein